METKTGLILIFVGYLVLILLCWNFIILKKIRYRANQRKILPSYYDTITQPSQNTPAPAPAPSTAPTPAPSTHPLTNTPV